MRNVIDWYIGSPLALPFEPKQSLGPQDAAQDTWLSSLEVFLLRGG